jgi:hypothetical protein
LPKKTDTLKSLRTRFTKQIELNWYKEDANSFDRLKKIIWNFKNYWLSQKINWANISNKNWKSTFSNNNYFKWERELNI